MKDLSFNRWSRQVTSGDLITRRTFSGGVTVLLSVIAALRNPVLEVGARKKRKHKKRKKKPGQTCTGAYFACGSECRLQGACCDSEPSRNCAAVHEGEGGTWVCCDFAGFGCHDLNSDDFSCGACGHRCEDGKHCLNGACLS